MEFGKESAERAVKRFLQELSEQPMTIEDRQETELLELGGHWDGGGGRILASAIWWKVFLIPRIRNLRQRRDLGEKVLYFTCGF